MTAADILYTNGNYNQEELQFFEEAIQFRNVKKDEIISHPGAVARAVYFNINGAFYQFTQENEDVENIIDLYSTREWFLNHNSLLAQKPANSFIKAYTDGTLIELGIDSLHWLVTKSTSFLQLAKIFEQPRIIYFDKKLSPADKYRYVLEQKPSLIQLFPLKMIASYLKITPETLSRVREQLSKQKRFLDLNQAVNYPEYNKFVPINKLTMQSKTISIRPFIGAKDYQLSRRFYCDLGFEETTLGPDMCVFKFGSLAFYLQNYYVKDWVDNTMIFVEVEDVDQYFEELKSLNFTSKYPTARLSSVRSEDWGSECFVHDPSGILWHFGSFANK